MTVPRISLGEAFAVAVFFCGSLAALRFAGGIFAMLFGLLVGLTVLYALIAALFDRGVSRAAAGGFAIGAALYGFAFVAAGMRQETDQLGFRQSPYDAAIQHDELNFATATLPTTKLVEPLHNVLATEEWVQSDTGETMSIARDAAGTMYDPWGRVFDPSSPAVPRTWRSQGLNPDARQFLAASHFAWALLFGYVGSLFARVAYARGKACGTPAASAPADSDATPDPQTNAGG